VSGSLLGSVRAAEVGRGPCLMRRAHAVALALSLGSRRRLKAALAKTTSHSTLGRPRSLTLRIQPIVFSQPKAGSIRRSAGLAERILGVSGGARVDRAATPALESPATMSKNVTPLDVTQCDTTK
jgi:hypothetical protein